MGRPSLPPRGGMSFLRGVEEGRVGSGVVASPALVGARGRSGVAGRAVCFARASRLG